MKAYTKKIIHSLTEKKNKFKQKLSRSQVNFDKGNYDNSLITKNKSIRNLGKNKNELNRNESVKSLNLDYPNQGNEVTKVGTYYFRKFKVENLIFIPEIRFEKASADLFLDAPDTATDTAASFLVAAIYKF